MRHVALFWFMLVTPALAAQPPMALSPRDSAFHALNRLGFGATPGLVDSIVRTGVMRWIEDQLAGNLSDPVLAAREREFQVLSTPAADLLSQFAALREERVRRERAGQSDRESMERGGRREIPAEFRTVALAGPMLQQATVVRAVGARHQLQEVMADFWFNHFNVHLAKGLGRALVPEYLERVIRPRGLGAFGPLLTATATSPAMLFYLDNVQSIAPGARPPQLEQLARMARSGRGRAARRADSLMRTVGERMPTGLNENYARELLELHTLGVDGGYTQRDVTETARILTGWGMTTPGGARQRRGADGPPGAFAFHDWAHDRGSKTVLGRTWANGGEREGHELLDLLARHPATLHHLSGKLCARLVADHMPDGCIDTAVRAWERTDGNLTEVVRAIVRSADFWAPINVGSKTKTPFEFVVSAVRAVGGVPDATPRLAQEITRLGQPLFLQSAPTGYPELEADWVNSGALLARMNFAMALASGRLPGVLVDLDAVVPRTADPARLVESVNQAIVGGRMTDRTRQTILDQLADLPDPHAARALAVGLALGGPEFQRQ